jgi:hypothetical protein
MELRLWKREMSPKPIAGFALKNNVHLDNYKFLFPPTDAQLDNLKTILNLH